jgi:hypothetical protein
MASTRNSATFNDSIRKGAERFNRLERQMNAQGRTALSAKPSSMGEALRRPIKRTAYER